MNRETSDRLRAINRRFYTERGAEFSASRDHPWPGWARLCRRLPGPRDAGRGSLRILDVGCGNGRFGAFLRETLRRPHAYVGVDDSQPLLEVAIERARTWSEHRYEFLRRDVLAEAEGDASLPEGPFDLVVAFGLFHHVPGRAARAALVARMAAALRPGGILGLTVWQFGAADRFANRGVDWQTHNATAASPIDVSELEPGDHLLRFGNTGAAPRYCHAIDPAEWRSWAAASELTQIDSFLSDGRGADLNRYLVLRR